MGILAQFIAVFMFVSDKLPKGLHTDAAKLGTVESVGTILYTSYAFPFEMASIILISAAVGAIVLAKKRIA